MFRKIMLTLVALMMAITPVLADDPPGYFRHRDSSAAAILNEELLLLKEANDTLMSHYSLTLAALGLFTAEVGDCGDTAIVTYRSTGAVPEALTGTYYVLLTDDGAKAMWTHDKADPALWQSGDLTSPAWGMPQLEAYLKVSSYERQASFSPYFPAEAPDNLYAFLDAGGLYTEVNSSNRDEAYAARDRARQAVQVMYSLTEEEAASLHIYTDGIRHVRYPDGHGEWEVSIATGQLPEEVGFFVTLEESSYRILTISISSGGVG